jgi:glycosyltransferase involved in cell wall biosynthesis
MTRIRLPHMTEPSSRRVVHLHTGLEWGGGEYQVLHLVRALAHTNPSATLVADPDSALFKRATDVGLPVVSLPRNWRRPFTLGALIAHLRSAGTSLLHAHDSGALSLGHRLARRLHVPLVLSRRIASPLRRNPWSRAKYSPARIAAVLAVSETVRDVFCEGGYPRERVFVVPSGLDFAFLDALQTDVAWRASYPRPHLVAGIGKLAPKKNWSLLIRTAAVVKAVGLDVQWVLAGDGPERERLVLQAARCDVADIVAFLGFREDAPQILRSSDVCFFPSVREGASGTVRQAMVMGVPVIGVDAPSTVATLEGRGWLVGADDVEGAARAVIEALTDREARDRHVREAGTYARAHFGFEATVRGTVDAYGRVWEAVNR